MNNFFYNFMPSALWISVITTNILGYLLDLRLSEKYDLLIWIFVTAINVSCCICGTLRIRNLHNNSYTDSLTKLKNRNFFYADMAQKMIKMKKNGNSISLLMVDIDKFKFFNDTYGHMMGDEILKQLSTLFIQNTRVNDTVVRWGGEEFAITLPNTNMKDAYIIAERIRKIVENNYFYYEEIYCRLTISIGIATITNETNIDYFIKTADIALYKAKENRNFVVSSMDII